MIRRSWFAFLVAMMLLPVASGPAGASPLAAVSTPCDALPDTPVHEDAVFDGFPARFLADVDGDGLKDVITGYWRGSADPDDAEHYLHVELASGWGTSFRIDSVAEFSTFPRSHPSRVVVMGGRRLIVVGVQSTLVGADYALFALSDCALAPVPLATGGYPRIWSGIGLMHSEWFTCRTDAVVMLDLFRGLDDDGELMEGILVGGEATLYQLDPDGFRAAGQVGLDLPRTDRDLHQEFPDCSFFVGSFVDDNGSLFESDIEWLALEGLTKGCNPPVNDRFCPRDEVTRGEMAAFLVRALGYTDDGGGDLYVDDDDSVFEGAIDRVGAAGVTRGCNPPLNDRFCPERKVTREEMAAFLVRAFGFIDDGGGDLYVDDDDSVFEWALDRLGAAGVTKGCNPTLNDRFCPLDKVTRGQIAAFLKRAGD
jgi:hypothetical protein